MFHGGEIDIQNIKGDTPLDSAKKAGHPLLMEKACRLKKQVENEHLNRNYRQFKSLHVQRNMNDFSVKS